MKQLYTLVGSKPRSQIKQPCNALSMEDIKGDETLILAPFWTYLNFSKRKVAFWNIQLFIACKYLRL
jgi:hypothetical protein